MNKNKLFSPTNQIGIDVTHPSRHTEREKTISLLNGESLNIKLTITNYSHDIRSNLNTPLWCRSSWAGKFYFTPTCLNEINLEFNLFNKKGNLVSDFSWWGFYFDISSKAKKTLFEKELDQALTKSIVFCLNNNLGFLEGNFEELNIPNEIQKNEDSYHSVYRKDSIDFLRTKLFFKYSDLVNKSNEELEKINLNLGLIQDSKILSGEIEESLNKNSYDPDKLIATNGAFSNFWSET